MLDKSLIAKNSTWKLAFHAGGDEVRSFQQDKPLLRRKKTLVRPFGPDDISEVLALKESTKFQPRTVFATVFKLSDGRFGYITSLWDPKKEMWVGRTSLAWSLRSLINNSMTTGAVAELKLQNYVETKK